jgi:acyl carrier protein
MRMTDEIRKILSLHANLPGDVRTLAPDADLHQAGLTSHATVNLMLALEEHFGVEFPERMLRRRVFDTIATIEAAITELTAGTAA